MSRYRHFASGVISAYCLLGTNIAFSLASVPLALHYLNKEEFGLWALVAQVMGMLQLIEMGVSGAFSRVIIDQKDDKGPGYARITGAAWVILVVQGGLIFGIGSVIAIYCGPALGISTGLLPEFTYLLTIQCLIVGCSYGLKVNTLLLFAHHRIAFTNFCQMGSLAIMLGLQWLMFGLGKGIYSLPIAYGAGMSFVVLTGYFGCRRAKLFPEQWIWPTWNDFRLVLKFGHNIFLIHVAGQFIWAGQVLIITKAVGLEAAAIWTVCTRPFLLICQMSWRPIDLGYTFFSEMVARGELRHLWKRYSEVAGLTLITATVGGIGFAFCNSDFVNVWTRGKVAWPPVHDLLLALWLLPLTLTRCGNVLIQATKDLRGLKFVFLTEALVYVVAGYAAVKFDGIAAMIGVFIVASTVLTASYTLWRVARFFEVPLGGSLRVLLLPLVPVAGLSVVCGGTVAWVTRGLGPQWQLILVASAVMAGSVAALRFALSPELKAAILHKIPRRLAGVAGVAFGS